MTAELAEGLRNWAEGYTADTAAVNLLIEHDVWLRRPDFVNRCVHQVPVSALVDPVRPIAHIDWEKAVKALNRRTFPASSSETGVLRIAASLAEDHPVKLRDALVGMDATTTAAVLTALTTAAGHRDRITLTLAARSRPDWL
ncbi:hypothetical protein SAMN05421803_11760 [Nocardiopsis flavescens]|uniref:Uncharacterized protein n=1 Tax=Nocardiopsis flavescens TaxID=758803 RepID=A0A1M6RDC6_9ACTN|nr:hypothetical protein [Nocardiopsis flavescens]SHK30474.1 hypothetical protein SAMN05421803_11760 [Nocardiopsis flavescens]